MKVITLQGLNKAVGTSSVAAALTYTFSKLSKSALLIDADVFSDAGCVGNLFGVPKQDYGWPEALMNGLGLVNTQEHNVFYQYCQDCFYLAGGAVPSQADSDALISELFSELSKLKSLEYVVMDAGFRRTKQAQAIARRSDLVITVLACDGGSIYKLGESSIADNEFLLVNRLMASSRVERDVLELLRGSDCGRNFLKNTIAYDEVMMEAMMQQQTINRFLPVSSPAADIEKTAFEIMRLCSVATSQQVKTLSTPSSDFVSLGNRE